MTDHWHDVDTLDGARRWLTRSSISERSAGGVWMAGKRVLAEYDAQAAELVGMREQLGEAVHTAFRKASDTRRANLIWHEIDALPAEEWGQILDFIADGLGLPPLEEEEDA